MASLATLAAVQPATINGLGGSSLSGTKLVIKPTRQTLRPRNVRYCKLLRLYFHAIIAIIAINAMLMKNEALLIFWI